MTASQRRLSLAKTIQAVFVVLVVAFVWRYLATIDWESLRGLQLDWLGLVAATLLALVYRYWGAAIWLFLLERLGAQDLRRSWFELVYVYAKAWLGRYLLSAGAWIVGKVYFAAQHGVGKSKLAVSGLLEAALQLVATLIVGLGLLLIDPRLDALGGGAVTISVIALALCLIALLPPVFRVLIGLAYRLVRRRPLPREYTPDGWSVLKGGALYVLGSGITGVSYFLVAYAVYQELRWSDLLYVVGAASVASAVSLLAVFAPGGIGVREGVQVLFFSALMPAEIAVIVTVLMRVWSLAVDGLFLGTAAATRRLQWRPGPARGDGAVDHGP